MYINFSLLKKIDKKKEMKVKYYENATRRWLISVKYSLHDVY